VNYVPGVSIYRLVTTELEYAGGRKNGYWQVVQLLFLFTMLRLSTRITCGMLPMEVLFPMFWKASQTDAGFTMGKAARQMVIHKIC